MHSLLDSYFPPAVRFSTCLALALVAHLIIYITLNDIKLPHIEEKTIVPSVRLVNAQQGSASSSSEAIQQTDTIISTTSTSNFKTAKTQETKPLSSTSKSTKTSRQKAKQDSPQAKRQTRARNSLQELFTQAQSDKPSQRSAKQISTKNAPLMSEYKRTLIKHLNDYPKLYDQFNIASQKHGALSYDIQLNLFANGAVRSAQIKRSTGVEELDKLAITAAYNASPFPRPPQEDQSMGFSYRISWEFVP